MAIGLWIALTPAVFLAAASSQADEKVEAPSPSYLGQAVVEALEDYQAAHGESLSTVTFRNDIAPDFLLFTPVAEASNRTSTAFYREIAEMLETTGQRFELSTLNFTPPPEDPADSGRSPLVEYLAPALRRLHERHLADPPGTAPVEVRILFATAMFRYATFYRVLEPDEVWTLLTSAMIGAEGQRIPEADWRFRLELRLSGRTPFPGGWSHSKIVLRDRQTVVVGSQNITNDSLDLENPTLDINMRLEGEAAEAAGGYFDRLWERAGRYRGHGIKPAAQRHDLPGGAEATQNRDVHRVSSTAHRPITVYSLGRGHYRTHGGRVHLERSADAAIVAALEAARHHIDLSQQMLVVPYRKGVYSKDLFDALARALLRGVDVRVVLSKPWGPPRFFSQETMSAQHTWHLLEAYTRRYGVERMGLELAATNRAIGCHLRIATHRPVKSGAAARSHHKFFAIDDQAFYIGSQNLYPGGLTARWPIPELDEYGFLVDDAELSREVNRVFWTPLWAGVEGTALGGQCDKN